ncbi:hypothetical protein Tco_1516875 [Tanacetum coccineum]
MIKGDSLGIDAETEEVTFGVLSKGIKEDGKYFWHLRSKTSRNASSNKDDQDSEDAADKEEQHQMQDNKKDLQDEHEMLVTQELAAKAMDDVSSQAFEEEKRRIASQKKAAQATSTNQLSTDRLFVRTDRSNTLNVSAASTSTGDPTSAVQTRGKIQRLLQHNKPSYAQKILDGLHGRAYILFGTTATTPIESNKPLVKDEDGVKVDVHEYRSMIGSLMYLTASRPDIMFAVCACARFQVTLKASHLHAVKRIFRYLKHQPKLGLWYPRDSPFELEAFSDSDYAGASLDRKSTTGGCQFLGRRLISWQCKKQTIVANSTTEAEYVAAAHCCGQVLWIQNQMMDYGFNFMNTKIHIDNESTNNVFDTRESRHNTQDQKEPSTLRFDITSISGVIEKRLDRCSQDSHRLKDMLQPISLKGFDVSS